MEENVYAYKIIHRLNVCNPHSPLSSAAIMRRTAVCDHYILISGRIWAGGGSISLKGTMLTSALVPVLTYAVQTPPIAR